MSVLTKKQPLSLLLLILGILLLGGLLVGLAWPVTSSGESGDQATLNESRGCFRILVAAKDRTSGLCDVMMLLSLNRDEGTLSVLQIPRDTYAVYGDGSYRKLNGAPSASGGMKGLCTFLEESFGIGVDRYVRLSSDAFRRAVDAIGGVEIELEEPMYYEDPYQGLSIRLEKGRHVLDGEMAEWFVRYRSDYVRGDLGRMDAQKIFLSAFAEKVMETSSPVGLVRLASALLEDVDTDLGFSDLTMLAEEATALERERIYFVTAPGCDVTGESGGSYYVLSASGMEKLLHSFFGKEEEGFDPKKHFLNQANADFKRVYETHIPYQIYSSEQIGEEGLSILRRD